MADGSSSSNSDFETAKAYLMQANEAGTTVYDHLTEVLGRLLDEKPSNAVDVLETVSYELKADKFSAGTAVREQPETEDSVLLARAQSALLRHDTELPEEEDAGEQVVPNVVDTLQHFEGADVTLGRDEVFRIFLALKQLSEQQPLASANFWGKIFGTQANYIVAECSFREGEEPEQLQEDPNEAEAPEEPADEQEEDAENEEGAPPKPPVSKFKPPPKMPVEPFGQGANKKVYFVCNEPGQPWTMLSLVTPEQIAVARTTQRLFTGRLDAPIVTYPKFPGAEAEFLRAQIARITAGTHVSPLGLFTFDEEEEDEDEDARENFIEDEEFEGKMLHELLEADMSGWVHHSSYILPQGRCRWTNPNVKTEEDEEEDDEEEEEEEEEVEAEAGPPLLTPLQNDEDVDGQPAWSARLTNTSHTAYASVCISSNRWPGAHAYAVQKKFGNVYIGWGLKYNTNPYSPVLPPAVQSEYMGEDVTETTDPTRQEEEEFDAQQQETLAEDDKEEEEED